MFVAQFGVTPYVVAVELSDPRTVDQSWSIGDTLTLHFDQATDRGRTPGAEGFDRASAGDKAYVDALFGFSVPLGLQYMGEWSDDSTFVVTVTNPLDLTAAEAEAEATLLRNPATTIQVDVRREVRDKEGLSLSSTGMAPATAAEDAARFTVRVFDEIVPRIVNATAEDYDNADGVYGRGDVLKVVFDLPTDHGAVSGDKAFVDRLFKIEPPIGADYSGEWADDATFEVRALDTIGGDLLLCNHAGCAPSDRSNLTVVASLRNRGGSSPLASTSAPLSGLSGNAPPVVTRFEVSDPDAGDYFFSDEDRITIAFDRSTDLGAVEATRKRVDALFSFNIPLGSDYSGEWADDSTFAITITDTQYAVPLLNQTAVTLKRPVRSSRASSDPSSTVRATLHGDFGAARRPRLVAFTVDRRRTFGTHSIGWANGYGPGTDGFDGRRASKWGSGFEQGSLVYSLHFSEPTNRTCSLCTEAGNQSLSGWTKEAAMGAVDELFAFAFPLGESYSGAWADASTFEVAVVVPHYNQSAEASPQVGVSNASFAGGAPLYNLNAELPVSSTEAPLLAGDPALLMAPDTEDEPPPILPRVTSFELLDWEGGVRTDSDGTIVSARALENATFVLRFNLSAHAKGDTWRQCAACDGDGNLTMSFPPALNFSAPLGAEITAEWRERDLLLVYVVTPADVPPVVGETTVHTQSADCSDDWTAHGCTTTASATLQSAFRASFGARGADGTDPAPVLVSALASDPDMQDYIYSSGDRLTLTFDRPTDRAGMGLATAGAKGSGLYGDKRYVDALCDFSEPLAYDYSGEWSNDPLSPASQFLITITQSTCPGCTPMTGIATVKVRGCPRNRHIPPAHTPLRAMMSRAESREANVSGLRWEPSRAGGVSRVRQPQRPTGCSRRPHRVQSAASFVSQGAVSQETRSTTPVGKGCGAE